ncbi:hypothetical protein TPHA_0D02550 [Tetrapisispora phaffii CBS 4417]|uniref:Histone-lysine N-methyltransferase, H3 lysine-79 specific n=1 Tax=Tetrapisispora phaffii (strain ATCC 24235 / CBS 4417 / NBRC 1672 / NRRL Y-8282 / UCD 70-5) TaxID=1071381 RepID=G8BSS1_TETPH|nr:hypothetical protein TPHA_0D02550 [Tetrapisispora phaffii CBS 4417]CCE62892.1 hypothetical protein TPHA_0D02550 [Tetrapisispora phaffii CBS 4417]
MNELTSDIDTDSIFSSVSKDMTPEEVVVDKTEERINKKGIKKLSSVQSLLNDAYKYSSHTEYTLPESFLRTRNKPKIIEDVEYEAPRPKKKIQIKTQRKKLKVEKPVKPKKIKKVKAKLEGKTIKSNGEVQISYRGRKKGSKNKKTITKLEKDNKLNENTLQNERIKETQINQQETNQKEPTDFIDLSLEPFPLKYDFFDIDYLKSNTELNELPNPSTSLTNKYYSPTASQMNSEGSQVYKIVKLRYPLFTNYSEEFHVDFLNKHFDTIYNPMVELGKLIEYFAKVYIPDAYYNEISREIIKPMNHAFDIKDVEKFTDAINKYNTFILTIPRDEIIKKLECTKELPKYFIQDLLHVVYTRSIHPKAKTLKKYAAFSSYVYGELLPSFLSEIYSNCSLSSDKIFMDLGSGVGNCVVQAALEYGCKLSFGCEIMENASDLTEAQYSELTKRCKLFGIKLSPIKYSLRKSFIDNDEVSKLIKECDVLLINNFLFDAKINNAVTKILQSCKPGCKLISLKSLRPVSYTIDFNDTENILNRMKITKHNLKENSVSWTHSGGEYYISEVMTELDESLFTLNAGHRKTHKVIKYTR